jgi:competence protein ComEA
MRSRSLAQHEAAVARRLELLTSELESVREHGEGGDTRVRPAASETPQAHAHIHAVPDLVGAETPATTEPAARLPSVARLPGRHASRRSVTAWVSVPEGLRGRIALGPGQVAVVAMLAAAGLAFTCWWLVRGQGHEVAAPTAVSPVGDALATPVSSPAAGGLPSGGASSTTKGAGGGARVVVDVSGKVRRPGIAILHQGARVVDALRAAGGARPGVDLGSLNLARVLTDGEQIVVGGPAPPAVGGGLGSSATAGSPVTGLVNLNTADETTLESLPEVGPVTAQAIITWRTQHGGFASVDQLLDVDGIGDATLAKLTPYVTI